MASALFQSAATAASVAVALLATSGFAPAAPTAPPAGETSSTAITADIHVELDYGSYSGPITYDVTGVVVGAGAELYGVEPTANPSNFCGDLSVDVSLNPATISVAPGAEECSFNTAYVTVTLHGAEFASTTLVADGLFAPSAPDASLGIGGSFKSRGVHFAATDSYPKLDSYSVTGSVFSARWSGAAATPVGTTLFTWVPLANAAVGAAAAPAFTG